MTAHEQAIEWAMKAERENAILLDALLEIAKGEGAFSLDPLTFANNTIENMIEIANTAIEKVRTAKREAANGNAK